MRRREFMVALGGATAMWPFAVAAQQANPVIGYMSSRSPADSASLLAAFHNGLGEAGFVEGRNVGVEYRWAEGQYGRLPAFAGDLVQRPVSVLVATGGEPSALAAKSATARIPIVFLIGGDPVKIGLAAGINRPGGNATGVSLLSTNAESKRFGLLRELAPAAKLAGILINPDFQEAEAQAREVRDAAARINQRIHIAYARNDGELEQAFATMIQQGVDALQLCADPFFDTRRARFFAFANEHRIPAVYQFREYALDGGLMSYGVSLPDGYRQVGAYAGQILKGAKPAELPIVQSIKFEFVINLKVAKSIGLEVPATLLARADEVIE
jgi:putative tryptophan/tyrosine transport system substrate-binding protein